MRHEPTPTRPLVAALDIGGTKIAGGLVDPDGVLLYQVQHPTPARDAADVVLAVVTRVLDELAAHPRWTDVRAVGIGSAGPVDIEAGTVSPINIPAWRAFPLRAAVADHPAVAEHPAAAEHPAVAEHPAAAEHQGAAGHPPVAPQPAAGGLPVVLGGDAVAMTAAEHWRGAARPYRNALCLVVSTGVGAGLIIDGRLHTGPTGNAGHLGHISVDFDGRPCPCGSRGCVEGLASGTAIARTAAEAGWQPADGDASAAAVAAAAMAGDPRALAAFDRAARALAAGIAATATLIEIEAAVVGGGVARSGDLLLGPLRRHLGDYATLPFTAGTVVVPAALGTDAGLVGAAALARDLLPAAAPTH